jgi:hypothetical protein
LCLFCYVKKAENLVSLKQKGQKKASFLAFHKCRQGCLLRGPRYISTIVVKYKIHLYSLRNRPEKLAEGSLFCLFLKLVQINFIFTYNVRTGILYIDRNKRHSSPFINVVKGVFFVVRVTLVPVSYLSAPSAVHSYRIPGKFIRRLKSLWHPWQHLWKARNDACFCPFCLNLISFPTFLTLQDKHNIPWYIVVKYCILF